MQWFTKGKASLGHQHRTGLERLLSIQYKRDLEAFEGIWPYVLLAHKTKPLEKVIDAISHGGDAYLCEIIPCEGIADPRCDIYGSAHMEKKHHWVLTLLLVGKQSRTAFLNYSAILIFHLLFLLFIAMLFLLAPKLRSLLLPTLKK